MKALTIKDLYDECQKQIIKGNGDKVIMISDDDEGNGYHYLWYAFTNAKEILEDEKYPVYSDFSENIAKIEDTIILG